MISPQRAAAGHGGPPAGDVERRFDARRRPRRSLLLLLSVLAAAGTAAPAAADGGVSIVRPAPGSSLFGEVDVVLRVDAGARVELFLDGRSAGVRTAPPYEWRLDVGSDNRDRHLEAVVRDAGGEIVARASARYPAVVVHDQVDLGLRQLYVMVIDRRGERVLGLERADFTVHDDERPQTLVTFEGGDIPFTAVLLLDGSRSMRGGPLEIALAGARSFVRGMRGHDEARVVVYSDHVLEATPWHGPESAALRSVAVEARGGSAVLDHLYLALRMLAERQGRRVVVLLSDGWDLQSVFDVDQLEAAARRSEAMMIYWVRRSDQKPKVKRQAAGEAPRLVPLTNWRGEPELLRAWQRLERLVRRSGGRVVRVAAVHEVPDSFQEILRELREQYALGYYPDTRRRDGSWQAVVTTNLGLFTSRLWCTTLVVVAHTCNCISAATSIQLVQTCLQLMDGSVELLDIDVSLLELLQNTLAAVGDVDHCLTVLADSPGSQRW